MKLAEISMDCNIEIAVVRNDTSVNLQTTPIGTDGEVLYVNPFMHNGSMISFNSPDLSIEMTAVRPSEVPNFWSSVQVFKGEYEGAPVHIIKSSLPGVRLNRRNSFRVFVGIDGVVMQMAGGGTKSVTVKDISATGIGFIIHNDSEPYQVGENVHISYADGPARFNIDVDGKIVRVAETEVGTLYGCKFIRLYPQIDRYVTQKQLKERNKRQPLAGTR